MKTDYEVDIWVKVFKNGSNYPFQISTSHFQYLLNNFLDYISL